jgi:hypothetical protein
MSYDPRKLSHEQLMQLYMTLAYGTQAHKTDPGPAAGPEPNPGRHRQTIVVRGADFTGLDATIKKTLEGWATDEEAMNAEMAGNKAFVGRLSTAGLGGLANMGAAQSATRIASSPVPDSRANIGGAPVETAPVSTTPARPALAKPSSGGGGAPLPSGGGREPPIPPKHDALATVPKFASRKLEIEHGAKHGAGVIVKNPAEPRPKEGGADMPEGKPISEYAKLARFFFSGHPGGVEQALINGELLRYDPKTGLFGIKSKEGIVRTVFRPKTGREYYLSDVNKRLDQVSPP